MWALGRLRSGRPLKATDVAREFEVSLRTAYRDLDFLRDEWRVPVEFDRDKATYLLTEPTAALSPVPLSEGELVALCFAEKVLAQYRGTPFEADLAAAFHKLQELLPQEVRVSPALLDDFLSLDPGPLHTPDAAVFATVLAARRLHRRVLARYRSLSSNRVSERRLHPYHAFNHRGDWYLAAWDEARREVRTFALHRIEHDWYALLPALEGSDRREQLRARKLLRDSVVAAEPLFRARSWFLSDQFSVLDVAVAPMLWRLRRWEIDVADVAQSVQRYSQRLFARPGFRAGLSLVERDMRG